jgi:hypothetical protein
MAFDISYFLAAIGAGIIGTAIGGLPIFIICGVAAVIGAGINLATGDPSFSNNVAFGPILGPHTSFAGAAAAAVYAYSRGKLANGRDIASALMGLKAPDVLAVGGIFGGLGYIMFWLWSFIPAISDIGTLNPVAFTVFVNAMVARLVFGKTGPFGKVRKGDNRWLSSDVANWIPWQTAPIELLIAGLGFGVAVAYSTVMWPAAAGLWFGISTVGLFFLQFGVKVPVWHHIALAAEQAVALGGGDLAWGVTFAVIGAFFGDFAAQIFTSHGDNHIDPPAVSLFTTFFLTSVLKAAGAFAITGIASWVITAVVAAALFGLSTWLKSKPNLAKAAA